MKTQIPLFRAKKVNSDEYAEGYYYPIKCGNEKKVDMVNLRNGRSTQCKSCSAKVSQRKRHESII